MKRLIKRALLKALMYFLLAFGLFGSLLLITVEAGVGAIGGIIGLMGALWISITLEEEEHEHKHQGSR